MKTSVKLFLSIAFSAIIIFPANTSQAQNKKDKAKNQKNQTQSLVLSNFNDSVSYIIGADVAANLLKNEILVNQDIFFQAFDMRMKNQQLIMSDEQKQLVMQKLQAEISKKMQEKQNAESARNKAEGQAFLTENKKKEGVVELPSGLQYKILKMGDGPKPKAEDEVEVNYEGKFINGKVFDSSYERNAPVSFPLNGVIKGWTEGLQLMNTGSVFEFYIPSDLAYGDRGYSDIGGGSTLIFKVELISIKTK